MMRDADTQKALYASLSRLAPTSDILPDEPMDRHTTFRAGGKAAFYLKVANPSEAYALHHFLHTAQIPFVIAGRGSNLLVSDRGFDGVILTLSGDAFREVEIDENEMFVGAAVTLTEAAAAAYEAGLSGMEELAGIPGTVGGALAMNAGAYGTEMKDIVREVLCYDAAVKPDENSDEVVSVTNGGMRFGYRTSVALERPLLLLGAALTLQPGDKKDIKERMEDFRKKRAEKQPLQFASAGSTFQRPSGHFAGQLIEEAGLKGVRIGGAQVSELHAGFIVNTGDATATELLSLMRLVREKVFSNSGITLEPEVRILGEEL